MIGEVLSLLLGELFESALGQSSGGGGSDLLHFIEVNVEVRSALTVCVLGDDFAPLPGEFLHGSELFR